jgi:hypothetical protein
MPAVHAHRLLLLALLVGAAALLLAVVVFGDGSAVDVAPEADARAPAVVPGRPTHPTGGWAGCATETYDVFLGKPWERIGGARHHASPMEGAECQPTHPRTARLPPASRRDDLNRTPGSTRALKLANKHELELHGERGVYKALEELTAQLRWTQRALWGLAGSILLAAVAVAFGG